jgi:acetoin utilization deacetylase AcuC-like enzyme
VPLTPGTPQTSSASWRHSILTVLLPRLLAFAPDFLFVSAGFDGHSLDQLHLPAACSLTEHDYRWVTDLLVRVSNTSCQGRMVSVLEGGYNTRAGPGSPLAESVKAHVCEMARGIEAKVDAEWVEMRTQELATSGKRKCQEPLAVDVT